MRRFLFAAVGVALVAWLAVLVTLSPPTQAQPSPTVGLRTNGTSGLLDAANDTIELQTGGLASLGIQTLDAYSGTWEVQCSMDGGTTYDADDEVLLTLVGRCRIPACGVGQRGIELVFCRLEQLRR